MKKVLFIDRDGTLIVEPPDEQIDSFDKLAFLPGVIQGLVSICQKTDYELVMVTNQDGLGTTAFPEASFWPVHNFVIQLLAGEGINFSDILIDNTFDNERKPTRKPGLGMMGSYLNGSIDLTNSYVIGDRLTDIQFAENLGCQSIFLGDEAVECDFKAANWAQIANYLTHKSRKGSVHRKTAETDIQIKVNIDGKGESNFQSGIGFFDHMLELLTRHAGIDTQAEIIGDLHVDEHHTVEDTAIVLGQAIKEAMGKKRGIGRYGFLLPMDESLATIAIDLSGRFHFAWDVEFKRTYIGKMPTELFSHFFKSFAESIQCNLHIQAQGTNEHHQIEAIFKGVGRVLREALRIESPNMEVPSTKEIL